MWGLFFNGIFGADYIIGLDGVNNGLEGGAITGTPSAIYKQIAYIVACTAYSFVVSAILAFAIDKIPGLKLRASEEASDSDDSWFPTPSLGSTPPTPAAVDDPMPQSPTPFSLSEEAPRKCPCPTVEEVVDEDDPGKYDPSLLRVLT